MEIRPMTEQDIEATVSVHIRAFKNYMNASLGRNYVRRFLNWFRNNSMATAWVVTDSGQVVGYVVGARLGYDAELNKALLNTGILAILTHPAIFVHPHFLRTISSRLKLLLSPKQQPVEAPQTYMGTGISLVGIAVDPVCTGKGAGALLMQAFEQEARRLGFDYMRLSVYPENAKARNLYGKSGWQPAETGSSDMYYYKKLH